MNKDQLFILKQKNIKPFTFNSEVVRVFDDMLIRSVPLYLENIRHQALLIQKFYRENTKIYDLGCSHGNLALLLSKLFKKKSFKYIGIDNSWPMIERFNNRLMSEKECSSHNIFLICSQMEDVKIENASAVVINLTLQFLAPEKRDALIKYIFKKMIPGGILLLTEKTISSKKIINQIELELYKKFKLENEYSELEISQKRESLERILIPDTVETHMKRLSMAGFQYIDIWLKWFNFTSFISVK